MKLSPEQQKAVHATKGRVLILAGAGSGKTSVLVQRIGHLIETGAPPECILGLTFTNKAAGEMRTRIAKRIGKETAKKTTLCTFHSFCVRVLRQEIHRLGYTKQFSIYDEQDIKRMVKQMVRDELELDKELPSIDATYAQLTEMRNKGVSTIEKNNWHDSFTETLYAKLKTSLRAYNAVDFDTLLTLTVELFSEHPDVLSRYQDQYKYIMIDEYQDTNPIQYKLAKLLSQKHNNLCVVGDDDQSIYGWRGAEVEHILKFEADTVVKLEQNYRSTPTILHAANSVIQNNTLRHNKTLFSSLERGEPISVFTAPTDELEAEAVIDRLAFIKSEKNLKWSDFCILYRSNSLARPFEKALLRKSWNKKGNWVRGIPYQIFGGTELFERAEVKDVLAYMKVLANPSDQEALLRIINVPRRGISEKTLDTVTSFQRTNETPLFPLLESIASDPFLEDELGISKRGSQGIREFVEQIHTANKSSSSPTEQIRNLLDRIMYRNAIDDDVKSEQMRSLKWENVESLLDSVEEYEKENPHGTLMSFIQDSALDTVSHEKKKEVNADSVTLMTFHSAKGLEFPVCFLVALEDHILPHEKSMLDTGIEEERRLLYVALTRAKEKLYLSMAQKRKRHGKELNSTPSRFLFEIPKDIMRVENYKHSLAANQAL